MILTKQRIKFGFLVASLTLTASVLFAQQQYRYKADLKKIDSTAVYKIELQPALLAKSTADMHDIRIVDDKGKYIAFAPGNSLPQHAQERFVEFPSVKNSSGSDTSTIYIADNLAKLNVNSLWIKLKNAAVNRSINLLGSDDLHQWFAIKDGMQLQQSDDSSNPDYEQVINFPASNYRYLKIQVNGKNRAPVNILRSGIYIKGSALMEYTGLPAPKFAAKDTDKITRVILKFDQPYFIHKLHFTIASPKYYSRKVVVYDAGKIHAQLCDTLLSSAGTGEILLDIKTACLQIDISNGDDNPLNITAINAYQKKEYLISYLEAGSNYRILAGDSASAATDYDLSFLKGLTNNSLPVISHLAVVNNPGYRSAVVVPQHNYTVLIWIAIIFALALLSFLTWKMSAEISLKNENKV